MDKYVAAAVYILAALTCAACAFLLARGFSRTRVRLLMWSAFCFVALGLDNAVLFFDLVIFPDWQLAVWRHAATLTGLAVLIYGLIWDSE